MVNFFSLSFFGNLCHEVRARMYLCHLIDGKSDAVMSEPQIASSAVEAPLLRISFIMHHAL